VKALILSQTDLLIYPLVTVVLFTGIYLASLVWIFRPGSKEAYASRSQMVFSDEEEGR
jgi:cbb3-type cytochrome oxidase subunit 3